MFNQALNFLQDLNDPRINDQIFYILSYGHTPKLDIIELALAVESKIYYSPLYQALL